jgi:hypothetical protein
MTSTDSISQTPSLRETKSVSTEFEVVRESTVGRPLYMTARRFLKVCHWIEQGESASEACRTELVGYKSFRRHVQANAKFQRRLKEAEEVREHFLREYHIENIRKHAPKNVLASLWWLERRYPNEFALRTVNRNLNSSDMPIGDAVSEEQLRLMAQRMEDFARETQSELPALQASNESGASQE